MSADEGGKMHAFSQSSDGQRGGEHGRSNGCKPVATKVAVVVQLVSMELRMHAHIHAYRCIQPYIQHIHTDWLRKSGQSRQKDSMH